MNVDGTGVALECGGGCQALDAIAPLLRGSGLLLMPVTDFPPERERVCVCVRERVREREREIEREREAPSKHKV